MDRYKIIATPEQLEEIGISDNLTGIVGILKQDFGDGYLMLEVTHNPVANTWFTNDFDIPKRMLENMPDETFDPMLGSNQAKMDMLKAKAHTAVVTADIMGRKETHWEKKYYSMLVELEQDIQNL